MSNPDNVKPHEYEKGTSGNPAGRPPNPHTETKNQVKQLVNALYDATSAEELQLHFTKIQTMLLASMMEKALHNGGAKIHQYLIEKMEQQKREIETAVQTRSRPPEQARMTEVERVIRQMQETMERAESLERRWQSAERLHSRYGDPETFLKNLTEKLTAAGLNVKNEPDMT